MKLELYNAGIEIDGRWLVRGVSLGLRSGSLLALIGPNGSGKSTLLRLLGGLWRASEGAALLSGQRLAALSRRTVARHIAYTPQDTHLDFAFTVREIVLTGRHPHLGRFEVAGERDHTAVSEAMRRADVLHLAERLVTELSGGERQRVIIARGLATEAELLLLDEPTANLDVAHALDVLSLCRELSCEGKTIVMALHDLNLAARFADEIALLSRGRVIAQGAPDAVLQNELLNRVFGVCTDRVQLADGKPLFIFYRPSEGTGGAPSSALERPC
jgi:iron complex transport system ATP-binding protein